ncbi:MAG TPA: hypothetical protein VE090_02595 [Methylomirabilota bacterium]|nr:hypothetical protein [Methylomirabilota bacterium]
MKSYQKSALRRKLYRELPDIAFCTLLSIAIITMFILSTNQPVEKKVTTPLVEKLSITPTATPTPTDEQMIKALPHGDLVWKTYGHESTFGKNDACKNQGLYNGFGYAQSSSGYQCFSSLREVATKVSDWFISHLQTMTVRQALCFYNTGKFMDECDYAEYTLAI